MSQSPRHLALVDELIQGVVTEQAPATDASGRFPQASIDAFLTSPLAGLVTATAAGGMGEGPRAAADVVRKLAGACGSTAMIVTMHYAGATVIEKLGDEATRKAIASGKHLSTLAFSEAGSRSKFWAHVSTAQRSGDAVTLDAVKSWVTSANHATAYVWSSRPVSAEGASTIWLVPRTAKGITTGDAFNGIGLRGNDSTSVTAKGVTVPMSQMLGADGGGLDVMLGTVLPLFTVLTASVAVGLMDAATTATAKHASGTSFAHDASRICDLPTVRAYIARMRIKTDMAATLVTDTIDALERGRPDAQLRVLEVKAAGGETATEVCDLAMRVCGGAAFRREVGVERHFRDARAGTIMAPTTDHLYDFIGKALCGMDVF
jgi:alkylation response protein AidB-like acyl-CoA dehydrogenase